MEADFECPRCGNHLNIEDASYENSSQTVECDSCEANLEVYYSISIEIEDIDVTYVPPVDFSCPECGISLTLDHVDYESGSEDYECDRCNTSLYVEWDEWGEYISAEVY